MNKRDAWRAYACAALPFSLSYERDNPGEGDLMRRASHRAAVTAPHDDALRQGYVF